MKKVAIITLLLLFTLIGCRKENIVINYKGISDNWEISYKIEGNKEVHDSFYTFKYLGSDLKAVKEVRYEIDGPREGESSKFILENTNEYTGKMKMTGGLPRESDRDIIVKVFWNDQTDLLILRKVKE